MSDIRNIDKENWKKARAEAREYLKVLTGDRFDEVVAERELEPLFSSRASYEETALAARRAVRWRIEMAGGQYESGAINLSMVLSTLLAAKLEESNGNED